MMCHGLFIMSIGSMACPYDENAVSADCKHGTFLSVNSTIMRGSYKESSVILRANLSVNYGSLVCD